MTLKLVSDSTVVVELDEYQNIAAMARRFADEVEAGEYPGLRTVSLLLEAEGCVTLAHWGHLPTFIEGVGLLEIAKAQIIADAIEE